jgi:hypothetical protein
MASHPAFSILYESHRDLVYNLCLNYLQNTQDAGLRMVLTSNEKVDFIAFLLTLTDKEFLWNKDLAFPR